MKITLATKITLLRVILIIPTVILYILAFYIEEAKLGLLIASCVLFAFLCASDFIDGAIARKTKTVSDFGKFLDPLADKIVIIIMLFLMVWSAQFLDRGYILYPHDILVLALIGGFITTRELVVSIFRAVAAANNVVLAADVFGKFKTIFLDVGMTVLIMAPVKAPNVPYFFAWAGTIIFYIGAVLAIYSGINYIVKNKQVFKEAEPTHEEEKKED